MNLLRDVWPLVSLEPRIQADYERMRRDGCTHNLAEMLALQQPPQISGTDSVFCEGWCNGNQFEGQEQIGNYYKRTASRAGVDITGKRYLSGLARYPGDPEAWVSSRGEVKRIIESRGWGCSGAVNIKARSLDKEPETVDVAPDIVAEHVARLEAKEGPIKREEAVDRVKKKFKPHWKKKCLT